MAEWECVLCGYVHEGEGPFSECPACGAVAGAEGAPWARRKGDRPEEYDTDNNIALYFREIDRIPLLTAEQEVELARRIKRGRRAGQRLRHNGTLSEAEKARLRQLVADGQRARQQLAEANSRLVVSIAKKYMRQGVPFLDLIQEGNVGLMQAVDKFDPQRGTRFSTYATWWIRQAVVRALAEQGDVVRLPVHFGQLRRRLAGIYRSLQQELGREPTAEEIAQRAGVPVERVEQALQAWTDTVSLEELSFGEGDKATWLDYVEDETQPEPDEEVLREQLRDDIRKALRGLTPREERVLALRFGLKDGYEYRLVDVAKRFGLTRERVRQIEGQALKKLREPRRSRQLRDYYAA